MGIGHRFVEDVVDHDLLLKKCFFELGSWSFFLLNDRFLRHLASLEFLGDFPKNDDLQNLVKSAKIEEL